MITDKTLEGLKAEKNWYKIWAGTWSILSCSHFAEEYTDTLDLEGTKFAKSAIIIYHDGTCSGYLPQAEKEAFSSYIANLYTADPTKIEKLIVWFRSQTDSIVAWMDEVRGTKFDLAKYEELWKRIDEYYVPHIINKWMVEALDPTLLEKYLHGLQEARLHAEPVFKRTEELMGEIAEQIAAETSKTRDLVLSLKKSEIIAYLKNGEKLPDDAVLIERRKDTAIVHLPGIREFYAGADAREVETVVTPKQEQGAIKGTTAYPGKVKGVVKIILDPTKADHFNEGDILVTGMTRPEYLALMQKAGAFVTDSGGILSHAAIVARELQKPCVIGTQTATKQLKDGDMVEVDADKGTVTIIR